MARAALSLSEAPFPSVCECKDEAVLSAAAAAAATIFPLKKVQQQQQLEKWRKIQQKRSIRDEPSASLDRFSCVSDLFPRRKCPLESVRWIKKGFPKN